MTNGDDSAYPEIYTDQHPSGFVETYSAGGLTKRELFAAMAMQGMLQNQKITDLADDFVKDEENHKKYNYDFGKDLLAHFAIQAADALIEQLKKTSL